MDKSIGSQLIYTNYIQVLGNKLFEEEVPLIKNIEFVWFFISFYIH